eukprot:TRINITY_DN15701_c0_g1_i1.p1 TRINITY_DN15701_c0_g1~~TRINITY_DN15701_c0_g1_i1.p1  ORF type:complete len:135 (+),score=28.32 TRINITY_DN15701_c0_g1_i1:54-407(+)
MDSFYKPVGARTCGGTSAYTKQRMKNWERNMSGYGGGKIGHSFENTKDVTRREVRATTWMDMRIDAGWGAWLSKMQGRMWRRSKYFLPPLAIGVAIVQGQWELAVWEHNRWSRGAWM